MDPSFRKWGLCLGTYDTDTGDVTVDSIDVIATEIKREFKYKNLKDLEETDRLVEAITEIVPKDAYIFTELPIGSKSAAAMKGYGICVGVTSNLKQHTSLPIQVVREFEVKFALGLERNASKRKIIDAAYSKHPHLNWPFYKFRGELELIKGRAEHMADAIGALHAGVESPEFQEYIKRF